MCETITGVTRDVRFDTWSELLDYVSKPGNVPHDSSNAKVRCEGSFDAYTDWSSAVKLATEGYVKGAEQTKAISEPLFNRVSQLIERQNIVHDVEGMDIDVARYLDGEPECWQRWEQFITQGPGTRILRIGYNFCASAGISAETITARGAMVAGLIELLEYAGNRVELWAVFASRGDTGLIDQSQTLVKAADQPLDMPRVAFALSHPAMLRRIQFEVMEHMSSERWSEFSSGRGTPAYLDRSQFDIYLPAMSYDDSKWSNPEEATKWCIAMLKEQGISLTEF